MAEKQYPLSLIIKAVDKATAPLRQVNERMQEMTAPVRKLNNSFKALGEEAGLGKIGERAKHLGHAFKEVGHELVSTVKELALMEVIGGVALFEMVHGASEAGAALKEASQRAGVTADNYAQLQFVAGQAGVSQEEFTGAMDKFNKTLGEAKRNTGSLFSLLAEVSPELLQQLKGAKDTGQAFDIYVRAMRRMPDANKRAALAAAAFGRGGVKMANIASMSAEEIAKLREEFTHIAGSQEEFADQGKEVEDQYKKVQVAFTAVRNTIALAFFPVLKDLMGTLTRFVAEHREGIKKWAEDTAKAIKDWVDGGGIQRLIAGFENFMSTVGPIIEFVGGWPKTFAFVAAAIVGGPLIGSLWTLTGAIVKMGMAILATPFGWMLGLVTLIVAGLAGFAYAAYTIYQKWNFVKQLLKDVWEYIKNISEALASGVWDKLKSAGGWIGEKLGITRPTAGADAAAGVGGAQQANVTVDFRNAPPGMRVSQDPKDDFPLDLSVGPAMAH